MMGFVDMVTPDNMHVAMPAYDPALFLLAPTQLHVPGPNAGVALVMLQDVVRLEHVRGGPQARQGARAP